MTRQPVQKNSPPQDTPSNTPNARPTVGMPTLATATPTTSQKQAAQEVAQSLSNRREPLPYQFTTWNDRGYWVALFDYFDAPGWTTLRDQLAKHGYRLTRVECDGQQTWTRVCFVEAT